MSQRKTTLRIRAAAAVSVEPSTISITGAKLVRAVQPIKPRAGPLYLYAEKESPKNEKAAMKFLRRYLDEKEPTLKNFLKIVRELEQHQTD